VVDADEAEEGLLISLLYLLFLWIDL
jgi:hypothetical protein